MTGFLDRTRNFGKFIFVPTFLVLALLGLILKQPPAEFLGFGSLAAGGAPESPCRRIKLTSPDVLSKIVWPTESLEPCSYILKAPAVSSNRASISLAIAGEGRVQVSVNNRPIKIHSKGQQFVDYFFELPNGITPNSEQRVEVERISGGVYIRDRVEFLSSSYGPLRVFAKNLEGYSYEQLALLVALSLMFLNLLVFGEHRKFPFLLTSALGVVFFLSPKLFYYFDEWHILERFSKLGFSGVIHTHNEHSIIAFFTWYYALVNLFGEHYFGLLVSSVVLHVVCAFSLERFLLTYDFDKRAVRASAIFFIFSSLHTEVLHWAFEQSIILSCISGIWALTYLRRWFVSRTYRDLFISGLLLSLSPLFFGNGFIFFPLAFFVILVEFRFEQIRRYLIPGIVLGTSALVPVLIYHFLKHSAAGHGVGEIKSEFDSIKFIGYILTGSGLGTIGRGLGFYPNLTLSSVQTFCYEAFGHYVPWIDRRKLFETSVEFSLGGYLWLFLVSVMAMIFLFIKVVRKYFPACLVGAALLLLSFILPAIGRAHLGELQALSLRYQYSAMLGFSMIMCPLFYVFLRTKISKMFFYVLCVIWMTEQAYLVQTFVYFTDHGNLHRVYVEELLDWEKKGMKGEGVPYEGNAEMNGLFPLARPSIVPGSHPTDILRTAKWLRGEG